MGTAGISTPDFPPLERIALALGDNTSSEDWVEGCSEPTVIVVVSPSGLGVTIVIMVNALLGLEMSHSIGRAVVGEKLVLMEVECR